jgi:hypothetical protein
MTDTLFDVVWDDPPRHRTTDPHTSAEAAASLHHLTERRQAILETLRLYGPLTDEALVAIYDELTETGDVPPQSPSGIRTRRSELAKAGHVADTGRRSTTTTGRSAILWHAVMP